MTGRDTRSGRLITPTEKRAIKALQPLPEGLKDWAQLIVQLTISGKYWATPTDMKPGGALYNAIRVRAVRNRQGKAIQAFRKRYGVQSNGRLRDVFPREFLELPANKQEEVIDRSKRAGGEVLCIAKVESARRRANFIQSMAPTDPELKSELTAVVKERLETVPRN